MARSLTFEGLFFLAYSQGVFVEVPCGLVKRCKNHIHALPCGVAIVLGVNGYVFISPSATADIADKDDDGEHATVALETRTAVARVCNCVHALAACSVPITDTSIVETYDASRQFSVAALLDKATQRAITMIAAQHSA